MLIIIMINKNSCNKTKIVITLGPAVDNDETLLKTVKAGADIFRLNFSHGTYDDHKKRIEKIRKIEKKYNILLPVIIDLQGPKIRVGDLEKDIEVKKNDIFIINPALKIGKDNQFSISYKDLYKHIKKGDKLLIDDGLLKFKVLEVKDKLIKIKSLNCGVIKPHKGVNLPNTQLPIPALTEKDKEDLKFGIKIGVNAVALSFVRSAKDIKILKDFLKKEKAENLPVIAKIEKPEAVKNIKEIIELVEGIMVARGDLGVETSPKEVPEIQKKLIRLANKNKKFVITATQMLESMIHNRIPTRAETTDVFNAVLDGSDAVMLSGETAVGNFPVEAVRTMNEIISRAEQYYSEIRFDSNFKFADADRRAIASATSYLSGFLKPKYIACFTASGKTAIFLSKNKPHVKIIVFVMDKEVAYYLRFFYSVYSYVVREYKYTDEMINKVNSFLKEKKLVKKGDMVLLTYGSPVGRDTETNSLKIHFIS